MRIAHISSVCLPVPPPSHGGTEWMVHELCCGLEDLGHDVHLFASGDSRSGGTLHAVAERASLYDASSTFYLEKELEARNTWNLYRQAESYDVIHGHWPCLAPYFCDRSSVPTVLTYAYIEKPLHEYYRDRFPLLHPVCISKRQAQLLGDPDLPVVYNGIRIEGTPCPGSAGREGVIIAGRIVPNKGIAEAIQLARNLDERLLIVGDTTPYLPWSEAYYREQVAPHVDGDRVQHVRHMENQELRAAMSRARAFLFPLQWEEPFGLVVVEAMAAGTPVLTLSRGAMPELVVDGETGFVRSEPSELEEAWRDIESIRPEDCRRHVAEQFSVARMVRGYEKIYEDVTST